MRWFDRRFSTHTSGHKFDIYSVIASMILDKLKCCGLVQWTMLDATFAGLDTCDAMSLRTTYVVSLGALATERTEPTLLARRNGEQNAKRILFKWNLWFWMKYHRNWCSKQSNETQITCACIFENLWETGGLKRKSEYTRIYYTVLKPIRMFIYSGYVFHIQICNISNEFVWNL